MPFKMPIFVCQSVLVCPGLSPMSMIASAVSKKLKPETAHHDGLTYYLVRGARYGSIISIALNQISCTKYVLLTLYYSPGPPSE